MSRVKLGTMGWDFPSWSDQYYPEDMPNEWRLAFYANEFSAVVLPESVWNGDLFLEVAGQVTELDEGFSVYCMVQNTLPDQEKMQTIKRVLKGAFAKFVIEPELDCALLIQAEDCLINAESEVGKGYKGGYWAFEHQLVDKKLSLLRLSDEISLRDLRQRLQEKQGNIVKNQDFMVLLTADSPNIDYLFEVKTLLELMAIA